MTTDRAALEEKLLLSQYGDLKRQDRAGKADWNKRKTAMTEIALGVFELRHGVKLPVYERLQDCDGREYLLNITATLHEVYGRPTEDNDGTQ